MIITVIIEILCTWECWFFSLSFSIRLIVGDADAFFDFDSMNSVGCLSISIFSYSWLHFSLDRPTDRMKQIKNGCERITPLSVWRSTADAVNLTVNSNPLYENDSQINVYEKKAYCIISGQSSLWISVYIMIMFSFVFIQLNIHAQLIPKYWAWSYAWENDTSNSVCVGVRTLAHACNFNWNLLLQQRFGQKFSISWICFMGIFPFLIKFVGICRLRLRMECIPAIPYISHIEPVSSGELFRYWVDYNTFTITSRAYKFPK